MYFSKPFIKLPSATDEKDSVGRFARSRLSVRDSSTSGESSIAPLLAQGYSEIILVDIRYISPSALAKLIDFSQIDDALFLYSASVINNSETIK